MSTARKMRRKLNRALPGADVETVQKTLQAMQVAAEEQTADRIYKKLRGTSRSRRRHMQPALPMHSRPSSAF